MICVLLLLLVLATTPWLSAAGSIPAAAHVSMTRPGDVILGVSIPGSSWSSGPPCSGKHNRWGIEVATLVMFAVDSINRRQDLLPNVTIGFDIRDNCYSESLSIWTALGLASTSEKPQEDIEFKQTQPPDGGNLFCIIGTQSSATTIPTAQAASLYRIPVISPFATSNELSNKRRFPYFLRTVPPDSLQVSAIVDILLRFGWKYIGLYFELTTYGIHGAQALLDLAEKHGLCVAFAVPIREGAPEAELNDAVQRLSTFRKARVAVMIMSTDTGSLILNAIDDVIGLPNITIVGSDALGYVHSLAEGNVDILRLQGSLFVQLKYNTIPGFEDYYRSLQTSGELFNPWFDDFKDLWMKERECSDLANCPIRIAANDNFLFDAVYAFAHALQNFLHDHCNSSRSDCNSTIQGITGHDFFPYLMNLQFEGLAGKYSFDANGNPGGNYRILNLQVHSGVIHLDEVGNWSASGDSEHRLYMNTPAIQWGGEAHSPTTSICREVCKPGYVEVPLAEKCCFGCQRCSDNSVVRDNVCQPCLIEEWPDEEFKDCRPIVPTPPSWADPLVVSILALSGAGILLSALAALGLYYYRGHVLIKAASRELSSLNILGLTLAFLAPIPLLVPPSDVSCRASEIIVAMCFTMTYAPTLLKVNRIYRIFDAGKKSNKRPRYIGSRVQLTIAMSFIAGMIVIAVSGSLASPTVPANLFFYPPTNYIEAYCRFGNGFLASITCNLLLILACCYYAFKARKVPSNYNESKFIAISVYSTLVFGLAAVPVYITAVAVLQKVATLCVAILLNSFLTLFCVYLPKLYAIQLAKDVEVVEWRVNTAGSSNDTGTTTVSSVLGKTKVQPASAN